MLAAGGNPLGLTTSALVAGVPGLCAALQRLIDFRARSEWFFIKAAELDGLAMALRHEGMSEAEGSKKFRELNAFMERQWPQAGKIQRPSDGPSKPETE